MTAGCGLVPSLGYYTSDGKKRRVRLVKRLQGIFSPHLVCVCVYVSMCACVWVCPPPSSSSSSLTHARTRILTHTHPHKQTHINTRTSAGSVAVIIGKTSFDRIHTSPFVVLRDSSTCPGSRACSAYCTPVTSADESMNTGVGQGRQTPPTQVLGVMWCAVVCSGGGEGRGGAVTGRSACTIP